VLDADGQSMLQVDAAGIATWLSSETIAVVGTTSVLVDLPSGDVRSAPALGPSTVAVHSEPPGTHAWVVTNDDDRWMVKRFEVATGTTTPTSVTLHNADDVRAVSDGRSLVVTADDDGHWSNYTLDVDAGTSFTVDLHQRQPGVDELVVGLNDASLVAITPEGSYVAVDSAGQVNEYADFHLSPQGRFFGARTGATSLQLSDDGNRLLLTSLGAVQLYDTATRAPLGDPVVSQSRKNVIEGWLRPDGERVLLNTSDGVIELDLAPDHLVEAACQLAGRDLAKTEWSTYVRDEPYRSLCPEFGLPRIIGSRADRTD
jgi:hypothetical protein